MSVAGLVAWRTSPPERLAVDEATRAGDREDGASLGRARTIERALENLHSDDGQKQRAARKELIDSGAAAVPSLVELLSTGSEDERHSASELLASIGEVSVEALRQATRSESSMTRYFAVSTLGDLGPAAAPAVADIARCLGDRTVHVAQESGWALASLRDRAAPAIPQLVEALEHSDALVRTYAAGALATIGQPDGAATSALTRALDDVDANVRRAAAQALASFGSEAESATPRLRACLEDSNVYVRLAAVQALGSIGPAARISLPALAAARSDRALTSEANWAIGKITGKAISGSSPAGSEDAPDLTLRRVEENAWAMLGRTPGRDARVVDAKLEAVCDIETGAGIDWQARLGKDAYASPVVAGGRLYIGTDNALAQDSGATIEAGVLRAHDANTGEVLWQDIALPQGLGLDDFLLPVTTSSPLVEGDRLWYVTAQAQLRCLDTEGFRDGENDGPHRDESDAGESAADLIWQLDFAADLGVFPHEAPNSSVIAVGDVLLVTTSNGVDEAHTNVPAPRAPSFLGVDKRTGRVIWTALGPGDRVLHGQWSSPAAAIVDGVPLAFFGGGDGFVYCLEVATGHERWRFDGNPQGSVWRPSSDTHGIVTRNAVVACPLYLDGILYVAMGQDPEHGQGQGRLHAIDVRGRGDVSSSHRRWTNTDIGRSIGTPVATEEWLFAADLGGFVHAIDRRSGVTLASHDLFAAVWGGLIVLGDRLWVGDEDGTLTVFHATRKLEVLASFQLDGRITAQPAWAEGRLYVPTDRTLWALGKRAR